MRRYAYLVMLGCGIFAPAQASVVAPLSFSLYRPDLNAQDSARLIAADKAGNLFLVFSSTISPKTTNIHIVKTDSSGNILGALDFGGSGTDTPNSAAVDSEGNLIIAGETLSPDFPLVSPLQTQGSIFVVRLDPHLNGVQFSTLLGSSAGGYATSVALDSDDNIYVTGVTAVLQS